MKKFLIVLAMMLPSPVLAAGFSCAPPIDSGARGELEELEEVVVTGREAAADPKDMRAWLRLMVGQYTYEGFVDLCGRNNAKDLRPVTGNANCIGSGTTPNVHCTMNVRWPAARGDDGAPVLGGVSNLFPALVVYSLEVDMQAISLASDMEVAQQVHHGIRRWRLMFMQLDNKGIAEWGSGTLLGDTFISRERCVGIPGACQKITRITARPGSNEVSMVVKVEVDSRRVLQQSFLLRREASPDNDGRIGGRPP